MWIDFKLYFYVRIHKFYTLRLSLWGVVNWFQIVFLREDSQAAFIIGSCLVSCELISNCIYTWGFTRKALIIVQKHRLWIDFKLYFYVRIHKFQTSSKSTGCVVNWFQIVFLREDSQELAWTSFDKGGCELISNCIFTWGFTRCYLMTLLASQLWIDFKLYFYVRIHKVLYQIQSMQRVVNWFQIVFLREDSQAGSKEANTHSRCELISNCIFTWGFTRDDKKASFRF